MNLTDRVALVTGASRGLGRALAEQLAEAGAKLVLVARDVAPLDDFVASLGGRAIAVAADLGDKEAIHPLVARAEHVGPVEILVNNASALGALPMPALLDTDCEDLERVLAVNLVGPFRLTKAVAGAMAVRGRGLVLNISSDAAVEPYAGWGSYAVSKAALDHLTRIWASELGEAGLRFLAVDPGEMDTRMHADAIPDADRAALADPRDVARAIVAMMRDEAGAPNGARLVAPRWQEVAA